MSFEFLGEALDDNTEKIEQFEQSTLKLLLRRMGMPKAEVDREAGELGPAFTCEWLDQCGWTDVPIRVDRCFSFNLTDVLTKPQSCPLVQQFHTRWVEHDRQPLIVIYKAYGLGRLALTYGVNAGPTFLQVKLEGDSVAKLFTWDAFCTNYFSGDEIHV